MFAREPFSSRETECMFVLYATRVPCLEGTSQAQVSD